MNNNSIDYTSYVLDAINNNDEDAFNFLFKATNGNSLFYSHSICMNDDMAQEAVQIAYIKVYKSLKKIKEPSKFEGWLNAIVRNETLNLLKKHSKEINFSSFDTDDNQNFEYNIEDEKIENQPELKFNEEEKKTIIKDTISKLSNEQRIPIMMYFYEDLKIKEIAQILDIPESTVKTRLTAGKNNIKKSIEAIEKRDNIKLHNITPVGLFSWLLKECANQSVVESIALATSSVAASQIKNIITVNYLKSRIAKSIIVKSLIGLLSISAIGYGTYKIASKESTEESTPTPSETIVEKQKDNNKEVKTKEYIVSYKFISDDNSPLPQTIMNIIPNSRKAKTGDTIKIAPFKSIMVNDDVYSFLGWNYSSYTVNDDDVEFIGTWSKVVNKKSDDFVNVSYQFINKSSNADQNQSEYTLPDEVLELLPSSKRYKVGEIIYADKLSRTVVGDWEFLGWKDDYLVAGHDENGNGSVFYGYWRKNVKKDETDKILISYYFIDGTNLIDSEELNSCLPDSEYYSKGVTVYPPDNIPETVGNWHFLGWEPGYLIAGSDEGKHGGWTKFYGIWQYIDPQQSDDESENNKEQPQEQSQEEPQEVIEERMITYNYKFYNHTPGHYDDPLPESVLALVPGPESHKYGEDVYPATLSATKVGSWVFESWETPYLNYDHSGKMSGWTTFYGYWIDTAAPEPEPEYITLSFKFVSNSNDGADIPEGVMALLPTPVQYEKGSNLYSPELSSYAFEDWYFVRWDWDFSTGYNDKELIGYWDHN